MGPGSRVSPTVLCRRLARARIAQIVSLLALALTLGGCGAGGPIRADLHRNVERPRTGVVLFICDGLGEQTLETASRAGWLPNIQKRFLQRGTHVARATTCIPPITYGAIATMLTGVGPGRHTVIGNRWFDPDSAFFRTYMTVEDYRDVNKDCVAPTIYQLLRPDVTASIQTAQSRGVTADFPNWAASGVMWYFKDYTAVDKLTADTIVDMATWANWHGRWPTVLTCYFPGLDTIGHRNGTGSPKFRWALTHLDFQIGRICDWLDSQGLLETTYIVLLSDHGMINVRPEGWLDLMHVVRDQWGRNATDRTLQEGPTSCRRAFFDRYDTVVAYQNGRGAFLYFRGPSGWHERPTPELVEQVLTAPVREAQLWNIPGVALATYLAADDEAVLRTARGVALVRVRPGADGPEYAYIPAPDDVLGYCADPNLSAFVAAGYHDSRAWLHATAAQVFPDVVPHVVPLLRVHRAGQVVLFTEPGYSFVHEQAGHGGVHRDEMLMTFAIAGPGVRHGGVIDVARSVDLVPTLFDLLERDPPDDTPFEGVSLVKAGLLSDAAEKAE